MNKPAIEFHLQEAQEALNTMLESLRTDPDFECGAYWVQMQHLYRHINTAWNARHATDDQTSPLSQEDFDRWGQYPADLNIL